MVDTPPNYFPSYSHNYIDHPFRLLVLRYITHNPAHFVLAHYLFLYSFKFLIVFNLYFYSAQITFLFFVNHSVNCVDLHSRAHIQNIERVYVARGTFLGVSHKYWKRHEEQFV